MSRDFHTQSSCFEFILIKGPIDSHGPSSLAGPKNTHLTVSSRAGRVPCLDQQAQQERDCLPHPGGTR